MFFFCFFLFFFFLVPFRWFVSHRHFHFFFFFKFDSMSFILSLLYIYYFSMDASLFYMQPIRLCHCSTSQVTVVCASRSCYKYFSYKIPQNTLHQSWLKLQLAIRILIAKLSLISMWPPTRRQRREEKKNPEFNLICYARNEQQPPIYDGELRDEKKKQTFDIMCLTWIDGKNNFILWSTFSKSVKCYKMDVIIILFLLFVLVNCFSFIEYFILSPHVQTSCMLCPITQSYVNDKSFL